MAQKVNTCLPDEKLDSVTTQSAVTAGWQGGKEFHGESGAGHGPPTASQVQV